MQTALLSHPTVRTLFENRQLAITTMHGKELVMRPLIKQYLNVDTFVVEGLDTDEFGTFSGEIERKEDPVTTLRKKILKGLRRSGGTLGIGNEGSFGPHPDLPFAHCDQEIVMLIDLENDIEIYESVISTETNHGQQQITGMKDLLDFAERTNFPYHGLILKQYRNNILTAQVKGIVTWEALYAASLHLGKEKGAIVMAETDMRAFLNPSRMKIIERATERLLKKVISLCPSCQWPGFACTETRTGLPCEACGDKTHLVVSKIYTCKKCQHQDERRAPAGKRANPMYCQRCNP